MIFRRDMLAGLAACSLAPLSAAVAVPGPDVPPRPPAPARPGSRLDRVAATTAPRLELSCPRTGESWSGWFLGIAGNGYDHLALNSLDWFLRDWRESICVQVCVRLYWALAAAGDIALAAGGTGRIEILSGYRTPLTNSSLPGAARDSMHMYGRAVDIRADGVTTADLAEFMAELEVGGVGHYPRSGFVHIDSARVRRWTGDT